jgi:hypothetical protein
MLGSGIDELFEYHITSVLTHKAVGENLGNLIVRDIAMAIP